MSVNQTPRSSNPLKRTVDEARLEALREAIAVGIADIEAGRFRTFDSAEALHEYFSELAEEALADQQPGT